MSHLKIRFFPPPSMFGYLYFKRSSASCHNSLCSDYRLWSAVLLNLRNAVHIMILLERSLIFFTRSQQENEMNSHSSGARLHGIFTTVQRKATDITWMTRNTWYIWDDKLLILKDFTKVWFYNRRIEVNYRILQGAKNKVLTLLSCATSPND